MTKINKLVLHGFKSFAKRTEITFGNEFNVILGPNGSGKSNILDALTFVLGKTSSKSMRAEKSANLIYNGGKLKQPAKSGEVSIYFDNEKKEFPSDEKEVKITRIVTHSGTSKYKINDQTRTRQQVLDLMAMAQINPDAYNIILQGDIVRFVEMSLEERRQVIEEISGIGIYEEKKQKAVRDLDRVEERLKEADIVLTERKTHLKELKSERDQALKYKEMSERINSSKASYLNSQIKKRESEQSVVLKKINEHKEKLEKIEGKITQLKEDNKKKKEEIEKITKEIEEKGEIEQVNLNKEVEQLKISLAKNSTRIDHCKQEITKITGRQKDLSQSLKDINAKIKETEGYKSSLEKEKNTIEKEKATIEQKVASFKTKHKLDSAGEIEKEMVDLDKASEDIQKKIHELREKQQESFREKDKLEFQINSIDEKVKKVQEVEKEHKKEIDNLKKKRDEFKTVTLKLNQLLNEDQTNAAKLGETRRKLMGAHEQLSKLNVRNASIKETISGNVAVQKILELKSKKQGIFGTVADLGSVSSKFAQAMEVAAGPRIKSIVVEDDKVAAECIQYLKINRLGTATFIPLSKIRAKPRDPGTDKITETKGCHGQAIDLIKFDSKFNKVFSYVFENTLVVDTIDVARRIGIGKAKMVTLDGDMAETSGLMHGGFRQKRTTGFGFSEKETMKDIDDYEGIVEKLEAEVKSLEKRKESDEEKIVELRNQKAELEGHIIKTERSLHLESGDVDLSLKQKDDLKKKLSESDELLKKVQSEVSEANKELAQLKIKKQQSRDKITQLRSPTLLAELNTFEQKRTEFTEKLIKLESEIKNTAGQITSNLTTEKDNTNKIIVQLEKEHEEFKKEIEDLLALVKQHEQMLKEKETKAQQFYAQFKKLFQERTRINDEINKNDDHASTQQQQSREVEIKLNNISLSNAKLVAELTALQEDFKQYEGVSLLQNKTEDQLKYEINKFEKMREEIGSVNMRALEIYESVEKEYNSLLEKKDKLSSEREDVLGLMGEIEEKKKELFMKTFDIINEQFKKIFLALSTKGDAFLDIENPESPFDGGVLIKVKLTGTKFMDIKSLSGGEKTMTALAFIFAINEYSPASFYILDEVDAALDKHNSQKLAELVQKYSGNAQYIMISHNDNVISKAELLYGISMDEHGISKCTSLKI